MLQLLSLAVGITVSSPVIVSTCQVTNLYESVTLEEFGPPIASSSLALDFRNTDDSVATQVTFDVTHGGKHTTVVDRGRFSKGVLIERNISADYADVYSREPDTCAVASITFADGRRWSAGASGIAASAMSR
jgi:hypothetical protein